jgi:hypothetical protein
MTLTTAFLLSALLAQEPPPAYSAAQLHCARFLETSRSESETETPRGAVKATTDRDGTWSFRALDSSGNVVVEAWYDSLSLRRRTGEGEVRADTDGLIGGRYRGVLSPSGAFTETARPFIPDEVAEVADLSGAAGDLLPSLPPRDLAPGEVWRDSGLIFSRLTDTLVGRKPLMHFSIEVRSAVSETVPRGDTVAIPMKETTVEQGAIFWSPAVGLVLRTRDITVEATIPSGGRIRQPVRSRVVQHIVLTRLGSQPACR